jgi:S-formylglutathione hydrolase FrmB
MAGIGPVANAIYTNQQMALVASEKNALHNRFELQNVAANTSANVKQKEVEELRPAEETHMIDPDREHAKKENDQELNRAKKEKKEEKEKEAQDLPLHLLDIKV